MGAPTPELEISTNCKNDLAVIKDSAVETINDDLAINVRKGELTEDRREELVRAVKSVSKNLKDESNSSQIKLKAN